MTDYKKCYSAVEKHSIYDGDHCVADHLTEKEADTMLAELTATEKIHQCKNCSSTEFVLRTAEEKVIDSFDVDGKPYTFKDCRVINSEVICFYCQETYKP